MNEKELNTNDLDILVSGISGAVGAIPYVGNILSEIIHEVVPNQREDRMVKFLIDINDRLQKIEYSHEQIKKIFSNYKYGAFTYKCIHGVVNDMYDEKIQYYKNICLNGLTSEEKELNQIERILKIFSEMDYFEILCLEYYYNYARGLNRERMFQLGEQLGLMKINISRENSQEEYNKEISKQIALNNLTKNGLLKQQETTVENESKIREQYKITNLGELILKKIDII